MKKIIAIILAALCLFAAACAATPPASDPSSGSARTDSKNETTASAVTPTDKGSTDVSTDAATSETTAGPTEETTDVTPTPTETPTPSPTATPVPEELPAAFTLLGSKHVPKPDDQGSIGSCSSEAVTYMQFTVAVSQYMNHNFPEINWDPSSGNPDYQFSPKYTYNFAGAGTEIAYRTLVDNGCLPMSVCVTRKPGGSDDYWGPSDVTAPQSRAWDVGEGQMQQALNFRLTGFEENEYLQTNSGQLTTNEYGQAIIEKTKDALVRGNAVVLSGWSSYWRYSNVKKGNTGTLAKAGDSVIWNGFKVVRTEPVEGDDSGNHCVTIIGYDDDITLTIDGVTMKGAFQIRNSWGQWCNEGNVFMMYDAFNKISEHGLFNVPQFYTGSYGLSLSDGRMINPLSGLENDLTVRFVAAGETRIPKENADGETAEEDAFDVYPLYYLLCAGKYVSFKDGKRVLSDEPDPLFKVALIPADKILPAPAAGETGEAAEDYRKDRVVIMQVREGEDNLFLSLTAFVNGSEYTFAELPEDGEKATFFVEKMFDKDEDGSFSSMIATGIKYGGVYERTGTIYRFSWTYWDKDIAVGLPELMVEAEISMTNRESLSFVLTRTDRNGVQNEYEPAFSSIRLKDGSAPSFSLKDTDHLSFSGKLNPTKPETGYFTCHFTPLFSVFGQKPEDYLWGVVIRGSGVCVKGLKLIDASGNVLSQIKTGETESMAERASGKYVFDLGGTVKTYIGEGTFRIRNAGTGKLLTLAKNKMTFDFETGKANEAELGVFTLKYDETDGAFRLWDFRDEYVLDINGSKASNGVRAQLNRAQSKRTTQAWNLVMNGDGTFKIVLRDDPTLVFGPQKGNFTIHTDASSPDDCWELVYASGTRKGVNDVSGVFVSTETLQDEKGVHVTVRAPERYTEGAITLRIVRAGETVDTIPVTLENGSATVDLKLDGDTYLFISELDGVPYGTQTICSVF